MLLNLALTAAIEQARQGRNAMVVIAHSDVGVENPEIQRLVSGEIAKAARFAREHGVTAVVRVSNRRCQHGFAIGPAKCCANAWTPSPLDCAG